jgi:hypothetical protein
MVHAVAQLVEALRYKPESRGFDPSLLPDVVECGCVYARSEQAEKLPLKQ